MRLYFATSLILLVTCATITRFAMAQGFSADQAAARMTVPAGLEITVVASEPLVRQPVAIDFDDRGRLWVIQYLQYPNPAGLRRVKVDRYSRTTYDRHPEPPPNGPRGADRITILTDHDGDGRMDVSHDFVDGLNLTTGFAFGHGGVFVLNVPYLLFYADQNRDDVPDGPPEVLLTGFGMDDAHSVANSLMFGPDGWLYGCQGSTVTSNIRGIEFQQGVWRYHPRTHKFELFCEGGGNSWGLDFDALGELFYSTNFGGYVALHGVPGAYYVKSFGKHGALHNPYAYGYFEHMAHDNFVGGHVTAGGIVYQADLLPPSYRGTYIAADLLGHAIRWHWIRPNGSTYCTANGGELALGNDTWFAPCDVTQGPDGAVYIADWYDQRTAHPDPDADWDRSNGRVYRIAPTDFQPVATGDLQQLSDDALIGELDNANEWYVRRARRILRERARPQTIERLVGELDAATDERAALNRLWTLAGCDAVDDQLAERLLHSAHPSVRAWAVRLIGEKRKASAAVAAALDGLAETDDSVVVRRELAATARRLPAAEAMPILNAMMLRSVDTDDPYVPLLIWWAIEAHATSGRGEVLGRFANASAWNVPLKRAVILPRLMRRWAAEATAESLVACNTLLNSAADADAESTLLNSLAAGLNERGAPQADMRGTLFTDVAPKNVGTESPPPTNAQELLALMPAELINGIQTRWLAAPMDGTLTQLAVTLDLPRAREAVLARAADQSIPEAARIAAVGQVRRFAGADRAGQLLGMFQHESSEEVQLAILDALAALNAPEVADRLLVLHPTLHPQVQPRVHEVMLGRAAWAGKFLAAVERGDIPAEEVTIEQVRVVALHGNAELDALVRKWWGNVSGGTPEEKLAEMRRLSNDLRAGAGDPLRGREQFRKHCASCHQLFGEGNKIGPELTTANRQDQVFLLNSLVDPSAVVRKEYLSYVVQSRAGQVFTGVIVEQSPARVVLLDAKNQRLEIPQDDIEEFAESAASLMPENLYKELNPQQLRDLFAYLRLPQPLQGGR